MLKDKKIKKITQNNTKNSFPLKFTHFNVNYKFLSGQGKSSLFY